MSSLQHQIKNGTSEPIRGQKEKQYYNESND
nr:MAG TPA: hypothetical protein [Caudoviricetes sp.]